MNKEISAPGSGWRTCDPDTPSGVDDPARRRWLAASGAVGLSGVLAACGGGGGGGGAGGASASGPWSCFAQPRVPPPSTDAAKALAVRALALDSLRSHHARAVVLRVTVDGREILTEAFGVSGDGEAATTDMHFRNGAVAIALVAMLLLRLVDEGVVGLDDTIQRWLPEIPHAERVTLRHLAQMTSGFADYVQDADMIRSFLEEPFRHWTPQQLLAHAIHKPLFFEPGTNWAYAHTNYVILGLALERITGRPVDVLMQEKILGPLCLTQTRDPQSPAIPSPVLRAFSAERREVMGIAPGASFYEESTFWDPSWTLTRGAVQVTDIYDMHACAVAFGRGTLLSPQSHAAQVSTAPRGKTTAVPGCPTCFPHSEDYAFGLGVVLSGSWVMQTPRFGGYAGVAAYHAGSRIAIAVANTFAPGAFDETGEYSNEAERLFGRIGKLLLPDDAPPISRLDG